MAQNDTTFEGQELLSEEEVLAMEELAAKKKQIKDITLIELASKIETKLSERSARRQTKEQEWVECARLYWGSLASSDGPRTTSDQPFKESKFRRRADVNLVATKCDIAISQCVSMQFATGEKNWDMWPAANEDKQENAAKAELMALEIETQLDKCKYGFQCRLAITDRVILGSGVLKGPVNTGKVCKEYAPSQGGMWLPTVKVNYYPDVVRVNPWFFYPDDSTNEFSKCEDSIELHPMSKSQLSEYAKHDGFNAEAIKRVLKKEPENYVNSNMTTYANITDNTNPNLFANKYKVIEYHGPLDEEMMESLDLEAFYESVGGEYYAEIWVCQGEVIRLSLENIEASFEIPYAMATFKKDPGNVFGFGQPLTMRDAQRVGTQVWRMILDNSSLSSGPQAAVQQRFIRPADGIWEIEPRKVWNLSDPTLKVQDAIQFFNVPNVVEQLLPVLNLAREFAQEESNTPLIAAGMGSGDNAESATGQLIMKQQSTVLNDFLAEDWDDQVTQKIIDRMYGWNMQYNPKPEIKGNYIIDVRSSTEYKNKQLYIRDVERLSMEAAQNPEMAKRIDMSALTKMRLEMMHLPNRTIIRTDEQVAQIEAQQAQQPNPEMMEMEIKMGELAAKKEDQKMARLKLAFELRQQQQREKWEHDEKMSANYARTVESQAMVLRSQNEKETELIKLAAKSKDEGAKAQIMAGMNRENNETKLFMKSMEETRKAREALLTERELDLAEKTGEGI